MYPNRIDRQRKRKRAPQQDAWQMEKREMIAQALLRGALGAAQRDRAPVEVSRTAYTHEQVACAMSDHSGETLQ